eukprot:TRINITY_DN2609_c3_g2_i2.p1 TRINITY_DN2609_c3_g2~~TRINITY_DN2609_c3_g2_i2.p1  ORF type:complete len:781 (+),score=118.01 TRINITY_DN2609_c3_g2_i2:242-2584(+)
MKSSGKGAVRRVFCAAAAVASAVATNAPSAAPSGSPIVPAAPVQGPPAAPSLVPGGGTVAAGSVVSILTASGTSVWYQVGGAPVVDADGAVVRGALRYVAPVSVGDGWSANSSATATFTIRAAATWACCDVRQASSETVGSFQVLARTPVPVLSDLMPQSGTEFLILSMNGSGSVYYALGSEPLSPADGVGRLYSAPLILGVGTTVVRARAWSPPLSPSHETSRQYTVEPKKAPPEINAGVGCSDSAGGIVCRAPATITLHAPDGGSVYYTTCGWNTTCVPFSAGVSTLLYSAPIQIAQPAVMTMAAVVGGNTGAGSLLSLSVVTSKAVDVRATAPAVTFSPPSGSVLLTGSAVTIRPSVDPPPRDVTVHYRVGHTSAEEVYSDPGLLVNSSHVGNLSVRAVCRRAGWDDGSWAAAWFVVVPPPTQLRALVKGPFDRASFAAGVAALVGCCAERVRVSGIAPDGRQPDMLVADFVIDTQTSASEPTSDHLSERLITAGTGELKDRLNARAIWDAAAARAPAADNDDDSDWWFYDDDDWDDYCFPYIRWWWWLIFCLIILLLLCSCIAAYLATRPKKRNTEEDAINNEPTAGGGHLDRPLLNDTQPVQEDRPWSTTPLDEDAQHPDDREQVRQIADEPVARYPSQQPPQTQALRSATPHTQPPPVLGPPRVLWTQAQQTPAVPAALVSPMRTRQRHSAPSGAEGAAEHSMSISPPQQTAAALSLQRPSTRPPPRRRATVPQTAAVDAMFVPSTSVTAQGPPYIPATPTHHRTVQGVNLSDL